MKYIPELTGIRGLAALMVFVAHASKDRLIPEFLGISYGMQGVFLFFTLSGFLMGQLYLQRKLSKETLKIYLTARVARIFPLYLVILIASFLISNFIYNNFHYDFRDPLKFLLGLFFINTPYELWTVPIEVQFYGGFILFWYFYSKEKRNKLILILIPIFILIPSIAYFIIKHKIPHVMPSFSLFFFFGVLLSVLKVKGSLETIRNKVPAFVSWLILLLFIINLAGMRKLLGVSEIRPWQNTYSLVLLALFFILVITKPENFLGLRIKPMIFLGEISYSFYMIHRPIMKITGSYNWHPYMTLIVSLGVTIIIAYFLFRTIEVPARKFITRKFTGDSKNN